MDNKMLAVAAVLLLLFFFLLLLSLREAAKKTLALPSLPSGLMAIGLLFLSLLVFK